MDELPLRSFIFLVMSSIKITRSLINTARRSLTTDGEEEKRGGLMPFSFDVAGGVCDQQSIRNIREFDPLSSFE